MRPVRSDTNYLSGPSVITEPRDRATNYRHPAHLIVTARDGEQTTLGRLMVPVMLADKLVCI